MPTESAILSAVENPIPQMSRQSLYGSAFTTATASGPYLRTIFVILTTDIPYVWPKIMFSRSVSFWRQLARIFSMVFAPSPLTSRRRPDWCESTFRVFSPNFSTMRLA